MRWISAPFHDMMAGLERCLQRGGSMLLIIFLGLLVGWWVYVPLHEMLHALGCVASGGEVERLELDPLYGGGILNRWLPWVVPAKGYAGRLAGFDTHGNDLIYLATDLAPFLLTLYPGVWLLRRAGRRRRPFAFGLALPFALAPLLSLTGDAYEIGSIGVTQVTPFAALSEALRGDDLFVVAGQVMPLGPVAWAGCLLATLLGTVWAFATYWLGGRIARSLGEPGSRKPQGSPLH